MKQLPIFCLNNFFYYSPTYKNRKLRILLNPFIQYDVYFYDFIKKQGINVFMNKNRNQNTYIDKIDFTNKSLPNTDGTFIKIINKYSRLYDNTDGIFGYNFFNKRIWKLDYNKCEIHMSPKISSKYKILKINGKQNKYITLTINNKKYNFIIDIGPSFINKKDKIHQSLCQMDSKYINEFSAIETTKQDLNLSKVYILNNLKFGKKNLENIEFVEKIQDPYSNYWSKEYDIPNLIGTINGNLLSLFGVIILDYKNSKLYY